MLRRHTSIAVEVGDGPRLLCGWKPRRPQLLAGRVAIVWGKRRGPEPWHCNIQASTSMTFAAGGTAQQWRRLPMNVSDESAQQWRCLPVNVSDESAQQYRCLPVNVSCESACGAWFAGLALCLIVCLPVLVRSVGVSAPPRRPWRDGGRDGGRSLSKLLLELWWLPLVFGLQQICMASEQSDAYRHTTHVKQHLSFRNSLQLTIDVCWC